MYEIAIVIFLLVCIAMVALILVQQGKGAGMGASFGAGASNTVFGSAGSGNFLTRSTWTLIIVFFGICLFLGWMQKASHEEKSSFSNIGAGAEQSQTVNENVPAVPADVPAVNPEVPSVPAVGSNPEVPETK